MRSNHDSDNNEDAKSTNSTLVNGGMANEPDEGHDGHHRNGHHGAGQGNSSNNNHSGNASNSRFHTQSEVLNDEDPDDEDEASRYRHGFDLDFDANGQPEPVYYMFYTDKRHEVTTGHEAQITLREWEPLQDWRMREKLKTISVALVMCLNIGIDPPDVVKTNPCAKLEAWLDPFALPVSKSLDQIGKALQAQYEVWQPRARYKAALDPSMEDTKKLCSSLRRNAKEERILFHYNGHGVPKPTASGEIWVFNKNYTQYIPVSLLDLQNWLGSPCIYVYDCSAAGNILVNFNRFAEKRDLEASNQTLPPGVTPSAPLRDCIQLAACGPDESLPMNPDLPADIFTACLTTPIEIALRWFVLQHPLLHNVTIDMVSRIPGKLNDRRTPLGELNWIFTSITDTIAWNVLSRDLFKTLFRQDLMVAALFRNYLLADRIMRSQRCTPMSTPALPATHQHPMWESWDLALDMCLAQLPGLLGAEEGSAMVEYQPSMFFAEQLMAFEVWLAHGSPSQEAPEQLAIVLQVLLSQVHRLRALLLLSKFLDLGPWAVNHALAVGISPYVLKLLQSPASDLRPVLIFIWARLLAVDRSFQNDLLKDNGFVYFVGILGVSNGIPLRNISEHRAMCSFILATFCRDFPQGQQACLKHNVIATCLTHIVDNDHLLRQWACLCIGQIWKNFNEAKSMGLSESAHERLILVLSDPIPEVRAAAMWALGTFISNLDNNEQVVALQNSLAISALVATTDASPIVRKELVILLSSLVYDHLAMFCSAATELREAEIAAKSQPPTSETKSGTLGSKGGRQMQTQLQRSSTNVDERTGGGSGGGADKGGPLAIYTVLWKALLCLSVDSNQSVMMAAEQLVDHVNYQILTLPMAQSLSPLLTNNPQLGHSASMTNLSIHHGAAISPQASNTSTFSSNTLSGRTAKTMANTLKRSASLAVTLKNYTLGMASGALSPLGVTAINSTNAGGPNSMTQVLPNGQLENGMGSSARHHNRTGSARSEYTPDQTHHQQGTQLLEPGVSRKGRPMSFHEDPAAQRQSATGGSGALTVTATAAAAAAAQAGAAGTDDLDNPQRLQSVFYDWCCEYFLEPQMKGVESDEPGSISYNERLWRRLRNERVIYENQPAREAAGQTKWDNHLQTIQNDAAATHLLMHAFEPHMVAADNRRQLSVWSWREGLLLNRFSNGNPRGTHITSIKFINEDDVAMLLVSSSEGVVRLYRKYESAQQMDVVTSWRVLTDMLPSGKTTGTITDWQQGRGVLLVGGDARVIRVWDAAREFCISDIPTRSGSPVTSITSDQVAGHVFVAGFGDGAVRVYDRRQPQHDAMVMTWKRHGSWIQNVRMQRGGYRELVSASVDGTVHSWDIRAKEPIKSFTAREAISAMDMHEHTPVIACGSLTQYVQMWNVNGQPLSAVRSYSGMFGQRQAKMSSLVFHPHEYVFGAAGDDGLISMVGWSGLDVHGQGGGSSTVSAAQQNLQQQQLSASNQQWSYQ